jgi:hypothetical protein
MKKRQYFKSFNLILAMITLGVSQVGIAQDYKPFTVLGTPTSLCRGGVETPEQLQDYFVNNRETVREVLDEANWQGDENDIFNAIASGDFRETSHDPGSRFLWTSEKKKGVGHAKPYREWQGKGPFEAYTLNVTSQCMTHEIVIPKACCNLSLATSSQVTTPSPTIDIRADGDQTKICGAPGDMVSITQADGSVVGPLTLDQTGCVSGNYGTGNLEINSTREDNCGVGNASKSYRAAALGAGALAAGGLGATGAKAAAGLIPFVGLFGGSETRDRHEIAWNKDYKDEASVFGLKAGLIKSLNEKLSAFVQLGLIDRNGYGKGYEVKDKTTFLDLGLDKALGKNGFLGGGVGYWSLDDSDYDDTALFVHGGSTIAGSNAQWFVEGRAFADDLSDIDSNNMVTAGIRYLFK